MTNPLPPSPTGDDASDVMPAAPGRVGVVGDWHGNTVWGQQMLDICAAQNVRTILHLGDFGLWPTYQGTGYLKRLEEHLVSHGQTLYWVDGNHDDRDALDALPVKANGMRRIRPHIWQLPRGFRWTWHDRIWMALGGAHSVDRQFRTAHIDWWPRELLSPDEVLRAVQPGRVDVLVCHDAPLGVPLLEQRLAPNVMGWPQEEIDASYLHRKLLRQIVDQVCPHVLLHGHYHWRYDDELRIDDGHIVAVTGLDCDGTSVDGNLLILDLAE